MEKKKKAFFHKCSLIFFSVSFLGWLWETVYVSILAGKPVDRGFLISPFCAIYGFGILFCYLLLGYKGEPRGILKKVKAPLLYLFLYFLFAVLIPSALELFAGWFFDYFFGLELWTYAHHKYNLGGYISPAISLFWGVALTFIMNLLFPPIKKLFFRLPEKPVRTVSISLLALVTVDLIVSFILLLVK